MLAGRRPIVPSTAAVIITAHVSVALVVVTSVFTGRRAQRATAASQAASAVLLSMPLSVSHTLSLYCSVVSPSICRRSKT